MSTTYKVIVKEKGTFWYNQNGLRHRDGGLPACEFANGTKFWYVKGQRHRDGGLPAIEWADGCKLWYVKGKLVSEQEAKSLTQSYQDKVVEIDGVKYKLTKV